MKKIFTFFVSALIAGSAVSEAYVKVTDTPDSWDGHYLIVYEGDNSHASVAFNGGLDTLDVINNGVPVSIVGDSIVATDELIAAEFIIAGENIQSKSGYYIGKTAYSNGLDCNKTKKYTNEFGLDANNNTVITASGNCTLKYNYAKDQLRFRFYKTGQKEISLYKYNGESSVDPTPEPEPVIVIKDTLTCDSARAAAIAGKTDSVYVIGYVTEFVEEYNATYHNTTFWIADTIDGGQVFEVYRAQCATLEDVPEVGDKVIAFGKLTYYSKKSTPELEQGCTFTIVEKRPVPGPTTSLDGTKDTYKVVKEFTNGQLVIKKDNHIYTITGVRLQ